MSKKMDRFQTEQHFFQKTNPNQQHQMIMINQYINKEGESAGSKDL